MLTPIQCGICNDLVLPTTTGFDGEMRCPHCGSVLQTVAPSVIPETPVNFDVGKYRDNNEMDMTPMVDVTFLLLIFFMVTAAFTMQKSFHMPSQNDTHSSQARSWEEFEEDPEYVVVRIDEFNTFHVLANAMQEEEEAPSEQDLLIQLRDARDGSGATRMLVMAHGDAWHERVVMAMDAGTDVGMEDVKLVTIEDDGI